MVCLRSVDRGSSSSILLYLRFMQLLAFSNFMMDDKSLIAGLAAELTLPRIIYLKMMQNIFTATYKNRWMLLIRGFYPDFKKTAMIILSTIIAIMKDVGLAVCFMIIRDPRRTRHDEFWFHGFRACGNVLPKLSSYCKKECNKNFTPQKNTGRRSAADVMWNLT